MGKKMSKRLLAMLMVLVFTLGSSLAVMAAPAASPVLGVKLTATTANYHQKTIKVKYTDTTTTAAAKYRIAYRERVKNKWGPWKYVTTTNKDAVIKNLRTTCYDIKVAPVDKKGKVGTYSKVSHRYMAAVTPVVKANRNGSITITAKRTSPVKGYKIYWSTNKNMSGALSRRVTTTGNLKNTIKASLKKGKTYYIRVIPVYVHNGNTYNGIYNTTKSVKVK